MKYAYIPGSKGELEGSGISEGIGLGSGVVGGSEGIGLGSGLVGGSEGIGLGSGLVGGSGVVGVGLGGGSSAEANKYHCSQQHQKGEGKGERDHKIFIMMI